MDKTPFDIRALVERHRQDALPLLERYVNPSFAAVLRTIGFDINFVRGQGAYLWDDRGIRYIDCLGGYAVFNVGRNHPVVREALKQAMDLDLPNLLGLGAFRLSGLLAKELVAMAPGAGVVGGEPLDTVFFANSGGEAIDAALKHARAATGRCRVVYCDRAYHGLTMGSLSVCGNAEFREGFGPLLGDTTQIAFNDLPGLERELARGDVAAFIVEPIQGKGVHIPEAEYLREAQRLCHKHGALLIADEIQTGLGRTGRMFACEHYGLEPDIMVIAKALSGGYVPVSAVLTRRWIHEAVFSSMDKCSRIQTTFGQNDLAMAAGLATLHVLREETIVENAAVVGAYLMERLRAALAKYEMVKQVRGLGLMIAIEFQPPRLRSVGLRTGWELLHKMDQSLFCQAVLIPLLTEHRVLAQVAGHRQDVIKLIPPLVLSRENADEIVAALDATIGACHKFPGPVWEVGRKLGGAAIKRFGGKRGEVSAPPM
ncbi:MAG: aspartate aminotransferase family protein [Phycisphaerales bacterium]|nr:aspartate aminotransferase family protein [Phycisphaerales bacterium]